MMIIPCGTDAPIYHYPLTTGGLIGTNVAVFGWTALGTLDVAPYCLTLGHGLHPIQWVTHMFLHANLLHLLGNMLFLWCFGLVVEGKMGWWKFLLIYMAVGTAVGMMIQVAMLSGPNHSALGASAAIFGILAIACVWAPVNEVNLVFVAYYRLYHFEATLLTLTLWYVGWDLASLIFTGFTFSGATAHLLGALLGLALGLIMVIGRAVDCEGYDVISVVRGRQGHEPADSLIPLPQQADECQTRLIAERIRHGRPQVTVFLEQGNVDAAIRLFDKLRDLDPRITWHCAELHDLISQLLRSKRWEKAIPYLDDYLQRFADDADCMRLQLARIVLLHQQRPAQALRLLADVRRDSLPLRKRDLFGRLVRRAKQMQAEGVVELRPD